MQELIEMVLNKRPKAALLAKDIGPEANQELIKLANHDDPSVRRVAMYCLAVTGGPEASRAMVDALLDKNSQVSGAAIQGLYSQPDSSVYTHALKAFDRSENSYTRQQIALIIGLMDQTSAVSDFKNRLSKLEDGEIIEGVVTALARLGDREAQAEFVKRLHLSQDEDRGRYLEHCEYINQPWLLKGLLPILDDLTPMAWIGIDGMQDINETLRACDIVVDLVASITGAEFNFEIGGGANYDEAALAEVKKYIESYVLPK